MMFGFIHNSGRRKIRGD